MDVLQFNIWSILILLGVAQGFFLAVFLWRDKNHHLANRFFAFLLISISLHLLEYALCISGVIFKVPHLLFTTYPLFFLIGPLYYFYVMAYLRGSFSFSYKTFLHFIPALLMVISFIPFYRLPAAQKILFFTDVSKEGFKEIPPEQFVMMFVQIGQIFIYLYLAYRMILLAQKEIANKKKNGKHLKLTWLKKSTLVFSAFMLFFAVVTIYLTLSHNYRIEFDYLVVLALSALIYLIGYVALSQSSLFLESFNKGKPIYSTPDKKELKEKLIQHMELHHPYLNENLKIDHLAATLEIPTHTLSELINKEFDYNFFDFINSYRIEKAKSMLRQTSHLEMKILAIAFESGFNNKATFNRVFKSFTGLTPSSYRKQELSK